MATNADKAIQVHSGEQFGIKGYWVNKNPNYPDVVYIPIQLEGTGFIV